MIVFDFFFFLYLFATLHTATNYIQNNNDDWVDPILVYSIDGNTKTTPKKKCFNISFFIFIFFNFISISLYRYYRGFIIINKYLVRNLD